MSDPNFFKTFLWCFGSMIVPVFLCFFRSWRRHSRFWIPLLFAQFICYIALHFVSNWIANLNFKDSIYTTAYYIIVNGIFLLAYLGVVLSRFPQRNVDRRSK
jgi:hypothetical protein